MSIQHVVHNSELTNQIKGYITTLIERNDDNFVQPPCVVKIHSGNPFRIADYSHYVDIKHPTLIVTKIKALNKNANWITMTGTMLLLKKWKFISNYDETHDVLKFDVIIEDVDILDKDESPHQNLVHIKNLYEDLELKNKFQRLKKYYQAKKFEEKHPVEQALDLVELPFSQLEEMGIPEDFASAALNKFPSTFSAAFYPGDDTGTSRMRKKKYKSKYDGNTLNIKDAERLVRLDSEVNQKDSVPKRKSVSRSEVLVRSTNSTPFKSSVFKHSPIVIEHISDKKFWDVMKTGPISTLNKRTPQEDDFEEVHNDVAEEGNEVEDAKDEYFDSFKLIKVAKALQKARSPAKYTKTSIHKTTEQKTLLDKRKAHYEEDFEEDVYKDIYGDEDEDVAKNYFKSFKLLKGDKWVGKSKSLKASPFRGIDDITDLTKSDVIFRRVPGKKSDSYKGSQYKQVSRKEVVNPLNQRSKINLEDFKTINWKMFSSNMY